MYERIKTFKRYKDYYSLSSFEVKISIIVTVVFYVLFRYIFEFYNNFVFFWDDLKLFINMSISGALTLLGMSFAGVAIIVSLFPADLMRVIERVDKNDTINRVLSQFEFLGLNLGMQIVYLLVLLFAVSSKRELVDERIFWIFFVIIVYHFFFNLFYSIALIGSCIKINIVKDKCNKVLHVEKSAVDVANEVRIDYLLAIVLDEKNITREKFLKEIDNMLEKSNQNNKEEVKKYLKKYYKVE